MSGSSTDRLAALRERVLDAPAPSALFDLQGTFLAVNDAFAALLGFKPADICGTHFLPWLHPDDAAATRVLADSGTQTALQVTAFENRYRRADGSWCALECYVRSEPECGASWGIAVDVTRRREFALQLQRQATLLRDTEQLGHVGGWALDLERNHLEWSDETYRIHELPLHQPVDVQSAINFYAPESRPLILAAVEEGMRSGTPWDLVLTLLTATGRRITVRAVGRPEFRDGKVVRLAGTFQDVTTQERVKSELSAATAAAVEASKVKSRFLATMSHEMRTPLNGIIGLTALLADTPLEPNQRSLVDDARACGENLLCIVNDVLDLAKIEANRLELESVPFWPDEVLEEHLRPLQLAAKPRGVTLALELERGELPVRGDPHRFRQVALNLVANAVKFTLQGSVRVTLKRAGDRVELEVRDTGVGIAKDRLPFIFSPFTQADSSTTRRFGGTGLGLAICKQLVDHMGGTLRVDSELGRGSTFSVSLPLRPVAGPLGGTTKEAPQLITRRLRVLLAEDNAINAHVALRFLERLGHSAVHVVNGREVLEAVSHDSFDVVLMDVNMPVMDGLDASRAIREWERRDGRPAIPIVAVTANAMKGDAELCAQAGMNAHLSKPLREAELSATLERVTQPSSRAA